MFKVSLDDTRGREAMDARSRRRVISRTWIGASSADSRSSEVTRRSSSRSIRESM